MDEKQQILVAAQVAGGIVGAILNRAAGLLELVSEVFVSSMFAMFVGPAFTEWRDIQSVHYQAFWHFVCGAFGFLIMVGLYTWVKNNNVVANVAARYLKKEL